MRINWIGVIYLGIFIISSLLTLVAIKYLCIFIAWLMMCL